MTPIIKQRIEQIRRGEVPEGYTHTRVGVIPMDWQETRVIDRFDRVTRKNDENNKNVLTISAQQGLISQGDYYEKEIASEDKSTYYLLRKGDFAYNKSYSSGYPLGAIKRLEAFDKGIVSPLYICFAPKKETDSDFYRFYFDSGLFNREIYRIAQEGARNHGLLNVATEDFFGATLIDPPKDEQKKIAQILAVCDRVIELKQKLVGELKKLKKVCLAKMFPQKGETVPEIRFPGFTAPWERSRVLDLLIQPVTDGPHETPNLVEEGIPFLSVEAVVENRLDFSKKRGCISEEYNDECCKKYKPELYDVYLVKSGATVGKTAIVETAERFNIWSPLAAMRCSGNTNPYFLYYLIQTKVFQTQVFDKASSGTQPNLSMRELERFEVVVPSDIKEQKAVADSLTILDKLITAHQCELEKAQKKKKALMQLLLTGIIRVR